MAQLVECPTLDFGSGHDPRVVGQGPTLASIFSSESTWDFSLPAPPPALSQINKSFKKKKRICKALTILPETYIVTMFYLLSLLFLLLRISMYTWFCYYLFCYIYLSFQKYYIVFIKITGCLVRYNMKEKNAFHLILFLKLIWQSLAFQFPCECLEQLSNSTKIVHGMLIRTAWNL